MTKFLVAVLLIASHLGISQKIKYTLNHDKASYVGFAASGQFWTRYVDLNPGSTIDEAITTDFWDISMRRYRLKVYGQWNEQTSFVMSFGNNNVRPTNRTNEYPKLLDAYITYKFSDAFSVGAGKNAWTGLSRYAASATSSALSVDIQYMALPLLNYSDDFMRKIGVFAKGQLKRFDYRIAFAKPYGNAVNPTISKVATVAPEASAFQISGYFKFHLLDVESQVSPFAPATYLGDKNLLTIGAGFFHEPEATRYLSGLDTVYHSATSFAMDLFYERPFIRDVILTFYTGYFYHNLGPDFLRQIGPNNPAEGVITSNYLNSKGNSRVVAGSGSIVFFQGALLKPLSGDKAIQVYGSLENANFDAIHGRTIQWESGLNYLLNGHRSKFTLGYQSWPLVKQQGEINKSAGRRQAVILQYQFKIG